MTQRVVFFGLAAVLAGLLATAIAVVPVVPRERLGTVILGLLATGAVVAAIVGALAVWLANSLARPLNAMRLALDRYEPGRGEDLLPAAPELPEVADLLGSLRRTRVRMDSLVAQLERDRADVNGIFDHMADGVLVLDGEQRVTLANPAAERLLGLRRLVGRGLVEAVRDAEVVETVRAAGAASPVVHVVELRQRPGMPRRWVQVVAARLPDPELQRTLVVLQDVTELRRVEAARRDFVANVSHELRTPIASLKALAESLEDGALEEPEIGREFVRRMLVEVDGLAHLVSELLELARVESGRMELDLSERRAVDLVTESVERMRPFAERQGLRVTVEVDPSAAGVVVMADHRRIGQVLANLLANAMKFTPPGGAVRAGVQLSGPLVEFWVRDTGIGIRPENLLRVFERFYKTDPSRTGSGTGLGLAIAKHMVRAHGGTIWAESPGEGQGATFRFTLRRAEASGTAPSTEGVPAPKVAAEMSPTAV